MPLEMPKLPQVETIKGLVSRFLPALRAKETQKIEPDLRLGLNIGRANLVACEISADKGKFTIERCVQKPLRTDQSLGQQLKEFFQGAKLQSKKANVSLKGHGVVVRFLSFPRMSRADFSSAIQFEAEKYLPFNISEVVMDFQIADETADKPAKEDGTMQVILVAARKTEVEHLAAAMKEAGFGLNAIDVDIFAITNLFAFVHPEAKDHTYAVVDLGAVDTSLGILSKEVLIFSRDIAFGGSDLTEFIKRKLNVSHEEALKIITGAKSTPSPSPLPLKGGEDKGEGVIEEGLSRLFQELRSSINYYYNQHQNASQIEGIYISGGLSQLAILKSLLEKQMEVPINTWDPIPAFQVGEGVTLDVLQSLNPYLPVSLGLGIRPIGKS